MGKCVVCGEETDHKVEIGSLSFLICGGGNCSKKLIYEMEDALPILWIGPSDLSNHNSTTEIVLDRTMNDFNLMNRVTEKAADTLWGDSLFPATFDEILEETGQDLELELVNKLTLEELVLFNINDLLTEEGKQAYRSRIESGE